MKTQYLITAALVALPMILSQANAGEKELNKNQLPKAVIAAFEKAYPNAKELEFEEETFAGKTAYEVEYKENGMEYEFLYSADGTLLQKEEEINGETLPEPVVKAIKKAYPKAEIKEVEQVMKPDSTVTGYEVDIKEDGKKIELELDVSGNILKTENE
ncbi:MAG: PepSY-like domain-containing protein [Candidatus Binatia bacterium]